MNTKRWWCLDVICIYSHKWVCHDDWWACLYIWWNKASNLLCVPDPIFCVNCNSSFLLYKGMTGYTNTSITRPSRRICFVVLEVGMIYMFTCCMDWWCVSSTGLDPFDTNNQQRAGGVPKNTHGHTALFLNARDPTSVASRFFYIFFFDFTKINRQIQHWQK
jgi:hypothetical protein